MDWSDMGWYSWRDSWGRVAERRGSSIADTAGAVRAAGGYGAEVVGPEAALWAGAKILRRAWWAAREQGTQARRGGLR